MLENVKTVLHVFFDGHELGLKHVPMLAHECPKRGPLPAFSVGVNENTACFRAKVEYVHIDTDDGTLYKLNISRLCMLR